MATASTSDPEPSTLTNIIENTRPASTNEDVNKRPRRDPTRRPSLPIPSSGASSRVQGPYSTAKPGYCGLLKLPRELRDTIYDMIIGDESIISTEKPYMILEEDRRTENQGAGSVHYQHHLPAVHTEGLLGCNHQVRDETVEAIIRANTSSERGICYRLCLMEYANSLQPTWLTLPTPPEYLQSVEVEFRMFMLNCSSWNDTWYDHQPGALPQYLLQMLRRFLHHGPQFRSRHAATSPSITGRHGPRLHTLTVIMVSMTKRLTIGRRDNRQRLTQRRMITDSVLEPTYVAYCKLAHWMEILAESGLLFGSIRRLKLQYDEHVTEWDITDKGDVSATAQQWALYGWGPILGITQQALHNGDIEYSEDLDCPSLTTEQIESHKDTFYCDPQACP